MVVEYDITEEEKKIAISHAVRRKVAEAEHNYKSYFYEKNTIDTYRKAYLGERAFSKHIILKGIRAEDDKIYDRPDKFDFKVGLKTIDVKTGKITTDIHSCIDNPNFKALVVDFQVQNKPQDIYVFTYLNQEETKIWIVGWATLEEVKSWELKTINAINRVCPLNKLRPMEQLKL